eukprot:763416-Hanusia_phi.AAC.2
MGVGGHKGVLRDGVRQIGGGRGCERAGRKGGEGGREGREEVEVEVEEEVDSMKRQKETGSSGRRK